MRSPASAAPRPAGRPLTSPRAASPGRAVSLALLVPLGLAVAAYARVLHGEFQFDDELAIERNPAVKSLGHFLSRSAWGGAGRPLTDLTFALDYAAGRLDPFGYHLGNLIVHLAVVLLLHQLTLALGARAGLRSARGLAVATAGIFAVHPLMSQAVSYVSQRAEGLASLLYVAALLLLLEAERRVGTAAGRLAWAGALALFVAGFEAKAIVVTLPAAWVLLCVAIPREEGAPLRRRVARALALAWPLLVAAAILAGSALVGLRDSKDAGFGVPGISPGTYLLTQWRVLPAYLRLLAWPAGQNLDPEVPLAGGLTGATLASGLLVAAAIGAAVLLLARSARWPPGSRGAARLAGFGLLWFFLVLSTTSTVVPLADPMEEHRAYLASWGPILAACAGAGALLARLPATRGRLAGAAALAAVWLSLAVALHARNAVWETQVALWTDVAARSPTKVRAVTNLGHALWLRGALEPALAAYRRALALPPDGSASRTEIRRDLAAAYLAAGRTAEGARVLEEALAEAPSNADLLNNLAVAQLDLGAPREAEATARRALLAAPGQGQALNSLGEALLAQGEAGAALEAFDRAAAADPDVSARHFNVAVALARLGRTAEACAAVARALGAERDPAARGDIVALGRGLGCGSR